MNTADAFLDNQRWLWAVVYARLGDRCDTEDVLQEISLAAVRSQVSLSDIQQIRGWLYQIAVRQVLLFRRKEARRRAKIKGYAIEVEPDSSGPSMCIERLAAGETAEQVRDALQHIRPSDRQVLVMKYNQDLSCKGIADRLGVSETTIQSRLLRARRRLRAVLVKREEFKDS